MYINSWQMDITLNTNSRTTSHGGYQHQSNSCELLCSKAFFNHHLWSIQKPTHVIFWGSNFFLSSSNGSWSTFKSNINMNRIRSTAIHGCYSETSSQVTSSWCHYQGHFDGITRRFDEFSVPVYRSPVTSISGKIFINNVCKYI